MQTSHAALKVNDQVTNLASIRSGHCVRLIGVDTGRSLQGRRLGMGHLRGAEVSMITNDGTGPLLIGVGKSRLTIGRGMAEKIRVK